MKFLIHWRRMERNRPDTMITVELVRFVCALFVMACHYGAGFWHAPGVRPRALLDGIDYHAPGEIWWNHGWIGVELFFVISGLVIAQSAQRGTARQFLRRRMLRLAPASWLCGCITAAILIGAGFGPLSLGPDWIRTVTFWPSGGFIDNSFWTIGIELAFYLAIAGALATGGRRAVDTAAAAIGMASAFFWAILVFSGPTAAAWCVDRGAELLLLPHGCFFATGVMLAKAQSHRLAGGRAALLGIVLMTDVVEVVAHSSFGGATANLPCSPLASLALFGGGVALLASAPHWQVTLARWIEPKTARLLGMATYPLYLLHQDAGAAIASSLIRRGAAPGTALLATAMVMVVGAIGIARWLEPAARTWLAASAVRVSRARSTAAAH